METIDFKEVMEIIHREFQSMKVYMEERFATKLELTKEVCQLEVKMQKNTTEIIRWMFLFWIGQFAAMVGLFWIFLKK